MEFNRSSGGVIRSAEKIFRLGSVIRALAAGFLVSIISGLGGYLRGGFREPTLEVMLFALNIFVGSTSVWRGSGPLDARRSIWLGALTALPSAAVFSILSWAGVGLEAAAAISVYPSIYLRILAAPAMGAGRARSAACSLAALVPAVPSAASIRWGLVAASSYAAAAIAGALTWMVVGEVSGGLLGCGGVESLRALTGVLLVGDPTGLERCLERSGVRGRCSVFVASSDQGILVAPDFHPGPLDGVGSSDGPAIVVREVEGAGLAGIYLRRVGTHSRNLCTRRDVLRVAEAARSARGSRVSVGKTVVMREGPFTVTAQAFSRWVLATVSGHPASLEDVPKSVEERLRRRIEARGLDVVPLVIDRHDSLSDPEDALMISAFSKEEDLLVNLLERAVVEAARSERTDRPKVGFGKAEIVVPSVGAGGIRAFYIEVMGEGTAYVCFDGNNMVPGLGEIVRGEVTRAGGGALPVICTTDTHATLSPGRPVNQVGSEGEGLWREIAAAAAAAVREAVRRARPSEVRCSLVDVDVCLAGSDAMNGLSYAAEVSGYGIPLVALGSILPTLTLAAAALAQT